MSPKHAFDLQTCARPNILKLQPYRCARDDYKDDGKNILLDANENAYGPSLALEDFVSPNGHDKAASRADIDFLGLNRYPDPHQEDLKAAFCALRNTHAHTAKTLTPANLFCGVGSDEAIDALLRCFCVPGKDRILTCPPTYGMYAVSAQVNDVGITSVPLDVENGFALKAKAISDVLTRDAEADSENERIKMVYVCSPGNPTGSLLRKVDIQVILEHPTWNGLVVVDEAYVDFAAEDSSLAEWVTEWPNLVVMQTLSKAFGLAGIRLGVAFAAPDVAALLNSAKAPYNISSPASALATMALQERNLHVMRTNRARILEQRDRLLVELPKVDGVGRFKGGTDSNFLLVEILNGKREDGGKPDNATALAVYETMAGNRGVVVRFRGKEVGCEGCLRITVGTESEVDRFLKELADVIQLVHGKTKALRQNGIVGEQERREEQANDVVS